MGEFTTKYKTTYSDGTSRVEDRIDMGKVGGGAFTYVIVILAVVALIPLLILLPMFLYVNFVLKHIKGLSHLDKSFQNNILAQNGYENLGAFFKVAKIKSWFIISLMIISIFVVDFFTFTSGEKLFDGLFPYQFHMSIYLFVFYWIVPFFINKDRYIIKQLTNQELNFFERLYGKKFKLFMVSVGIPATFVSLIVANMIYLSIKASYIDNDIRNDETPSGYTETVIKILNGTAKKGDVDSEFLNKKIYDLSPIDEVLVKFDIFVYKWLLHVKYSSGIGEWYARVMDSHANRDAIDAYIWEMDRVETMRLHQLASLCQGWVGKDNGCSLPKLIRTFKKLGGDIDGVDYFGDPIIANANSLLERALLKAGAKK